MEKIERIDWMIKRYSLWSDGDKIGTYNKDIAQNLNGDLDFMKANKPDFVSRIAEIKAEEIAREASTIRFIAHGWVAHELLIDTRKDIESQLQKLADYYSEDLTIDQIKDAYNKATGITVDDSDGTQIVITTTGPESAQKRLYIMQRPKPL